MANGEKAIQRCEICLNESDDLIVDVMMHVCRPCWEQTGERHTSAYEKRGRVRNDTQGLGSTNLDQDPASEPKSAGPSDFLKSGEESVVCVSPHCRTALEHHWQYCPACGRTKRGSYLDASGHPASADRKDLSVQALAVALGVTILGVSWGIGYIGFLTVSWVFPLDRSLAAVFAWGLLSGAFLSLFGFSMWLKFEGYKYGSFKP